jgi:Abortive infection alpha
MVDEDKLVKAGVEAALKPFADLLDKLAGPAAEEIGKTFQDRVKVFRFQRQLRMLKQVKKMLDDASLSPKRVPLKLLGPIIEAGALEEDDALQDKWAALLANASLDSNMVHPSFPEVLKQLTGLEATFLDVLWELREKQGSNPLVSTVADRLRQARRATSKESLEMEVAGDLRNRNLLRLGLIHAGFIRISTDVRSWRLTEYGYEFARACRAPQNTT